MRTWLAGVRESVQTRLWPVPTIAVVAALLLGWGVPRVDAAVDDGLAPVARDWLFGGDADAARSLLGAIASSLITVTSLTFSLTVVSLQLASSQFSPRLLRTFTRDQFVQMTLALFLATFTYALTVLRAVRSTGDDQVEVVPQIAVTLAFVLTVASVVGLVLFLAHLTRQIRVETMLDTVSREGLEAMRAVLPAREEGAGRQSPAPLPPPSARPLLAAADGFLTWVDHGKLLEAAVAADAVVRLDALPGSFLVRGTPVGVAWPASSAGRLDADVADELGRRVAEGVHVGPERTSAQDVGFALRQLTDVANKALSPGVNDPTSAVHALGHVSAFLCALTERELGPALLRDGDELVRVVLCRPDLAAYVDLGIAQPSRYGVSDPQVLERILRVLLDLSHRVTTDQGPVVEEQLARVRARAQGPTFDAQERDGLAMIADEVEENLRVLAGSVPTS